MSDEREEIARLIDPPFWASLDDTLQWLESQGGKYEAGWPRFRFLKRELAHVMELYDRADAILARAQGPGEAVAWRWRYVDHGVPRGWTHSKTPPAPRPQTPGYCAIEVEPLYAATPPREG